MSSYTTKLIRLCYYAIEECRVFGIKHPEHDKILAQISRLENMLEVERKCLGGGKNSGKYFPPDGEHRESARGGASATSEKL